MPKGVDRFAWSNQTDNLKRHVRRQCSLRDYVIVSPWWTKKALSSMTDRRKDIFWYISSELSDRKILRTSAEEREDKMKKRSRFWVVAWYQSESMFSFWLHRNSRIALSSNANDLVVVSLVERGTERTQSSPAPRITLTTIDRSRQLELLGDGGRREFSTDTKPHTTHTRRRQH